MNKVLGLALIVASLGACTGCSGNWNLPRSAENANTNTLFSAFTTRSPKYLDPTSSYSTDETLFTYQIYEAPYQYHYLKRPYELEPRAAQALAAPQFMDKNGKLLPANTPAHLIHQTWYDITIKSGLRFAPHPAFAKDAQGKLKFHSLSPEQVKNKTSPFDFAPMNELGTRELVAADYVYGITRLATPRVPSPLFGHIADYIVGLDELGKTIKAADEKLKKSLPKTQRDLPFLDLRQFSFDGAQALDTHTFRIKTKGYYPQFKYWLAMSIFSPVPWEAEAFYSQQGMAANNLSLNEWPVGTGPYYLAESIKNRKHVLQKNPYFNHQTYPCEGDKGDAEKGLLKDCGKPLPLIDRIELTMEKEAVPLEAKFLAGYYDVPEPQRGEYGALYSVSVEDQTAKGKKIQSRNIRLPSEIDAGIFYTGFNWLDPVVGGGKTPQEAARNRKLRQAISIAFDQEEYNQVFLDSRAITAMSPIPPGLAGYFDGAAGINPLTHDWVNNQAKRKPIELAKQLLKEAGYEGGRDAKTGKPLVLFIDEMGSGTAKAKLEWEERQLEKLGIQLEVRVTDYNRFQDKMRKGQAQMFSWGWSADYPDAENFLFLLYSKNAKAINDGENASNYNNPEFDALFDQMKGLPEGEQKNALIAKMVSIVQQDAAWLWGYFPKSGGAYHQWLHNGKPTQMIRNHVGYLRLDTALRSQLQNEWNTPIVYPLAFFILFIAALVFAIRREWFKQQTATARQGVRA